MTLFIKVYLRKQNCFMSLRVKQYYKVDINKNQSIKYNMHKIFKLHPLFFLVGLVFIILGQALAFLIYFLVVVLHEFAHGFVAQKLGYGLNKIYLLPFGAMLDINQNFITREDEIKVALAGPICNFVLVFICLGIWWIFPETYAYTNFFVFCNIITGLVNLLPCYPMDGGRIMVAVLSEKFNREKIIDPGSKGEVQICIRNKSNYDVSYDFNFTDEMQYHVNMKYKLKLDNVYIKGNKEEYKKLEDIKLKEVIVPKDSANIYTLEWYWEDDDKNDTIVGSQQDKQYYKLNLEINARQYVK